jgi:hypothetical protein
MTELKPCPFCGDPMEWQKGGYASHTDPSAYCPIATQGFVFATPWNTRVDADKARIMKLYQTWGKGDLTQADFNEAFKEADQ